jgi:FKBP-type peptidyl-prolyl cis-trans isomerase FkpA
MTALRHVRLQLVSMALLVALAGCPAPEGAGDEKAAAGGESQAASEEEKALYAFGASLARYASGMKLTEAEVKAMEKGLEDAILGRPLEVDPRSYGPQLQKLIADRRAAAAAEEKQAAVAFLTEEAAKPGVEKTSSGLLYQSLTEGTGAAPKATDRVKVHYKGSLRDGTEFDSSLTRGEAASFHLNRVVPCWTEGVQKMKVGGKARLVCPAELGYGERGVPGRIPAGAALVFEVELLEILPEVAATPPAAQKPAAKPAAKPAPKAE